MHLFEFGAPKSAINPNNIAPYLGVFEQNGCYLPPISMTGFTQLLRANHHHGTMPSFKANLLLKELVNNPLLPRAVLYPAAVDFNATGNAYLQLIRNKAGIVIGVKHLPAVNMRVGVDGRYCYQMRTLRHDSDIWFEADQVVHLKDYDVNQNIYGVPYWVGVIQSVLLGEDTRLVPRRWMANGAHLGNLFVTSGMTTNDENALRESLKQTTGVGNYRSMVIGLPAKGKVDEMFKVIPIGQIGNLSEFTRLANMCASDILEAWRIRPELAGMMPETPGGSGDLDKIKFLYWELEIVPLQQVWAAACNPHLPARYQLKFRDYQTQTSRLVA